MKEVMEREVEKEIYSNRGVIFEVIGCDIAEDGSEFVNYRFYRNDWCAPYKSCKAKVKYSSKGGYITAYGHRFYLGSFKRLKLNKIDCRKMKEDLTENGFFFQYYEEAPCTYNKYIEKIGEEAFTALLYERGIAWGGKFGQPSTSQMLNMIDAFRNGDIYIGTPSNFESVYVAD